MSEEIHTGRTNIPDLPLLSSSLNSLYNSLDGFNKGVFIRVYNYLWGVVNDYSVKRAGVVSHYWLLFMILRSSPLSSPSLALLSYLYLMTNKGNRLIHSNIVYNSGVLYGYGWRSVQRVLYNMKRAGYITRHTKDPGRPYSQSAQHNKQPVFIKMTNKGIKTIQDMEKDMNRILMNTSFNDLTGMKKA